MIILDSQQPAPNSDFVDAFVDEIKSRLRISDTLGWFEGRLTVLLPETGREGGLQVANDIDLIAVGCDVELETEVLVYPEDDSLAADSSFRRGGKIDAPDQEDIESVEPFDETTHEPECEPNVTYFLGSQELMADRGGLPVENEPPTAFRHRLTTPWWKRTVDVLGSGTGLLVLSPLFVLAAIAVKLNSPGPVFFKQRREGKDGHQFDIWKFRTMIPGAEEQKDLLRQISEQDGPAFKMKDDPRLTTVGRYLRKSCVDELPQLINVLRGDMSLVGPRPLPVDESHACQVWQRQRLRVLPGLTCIWQVDGGRDIRFDDWMRMDMQYLRQRSFWFDLKLILKTALVAVMHRGSV